MADDIQMVKATLAAGVITAMGATHSVVFGQHNQSAVAKSVADFTNRLYNELFPSRVGGVDVIVGKADPSDVKG
jgi:hypothetical protein